MFNKVFWICTRQRLKQSNTQRPPIIYKPPNSRTLNLESRLRFAHHHCRCEAIHLNLDLYTLLVRKHVNAMRQSECFVTSKHNKIPLLPNIPDNSPKKIVRLHKGCVVIKTLCTMLHFEDAYFSGYDLLSA